MPKIAIVVLPTYNESSNIIEVTRQIFNQQSKVPDYLLQILVVDDNSPDGTGDIVREISKTNPNIFLITGQKQGLGKAYIRGFKYSLKKLNPHVIFQMDADLSHDPDKIAQMLEKIDEGFDFVIGSRYIEGGSVPTNWSFKRKMNSKMGNLISTKIGGLKGVNDTTGGFRAIKASLLEQLDFKELESDGYVFMVVLLNSVLSKKAKITEIPINFRDRTEGLSKLKIIDVLEFIETCIHIRFKRIKSNVKWFIVLLLSFLLCYITWKYFFISDNNFSMAQQYTGFFVSLVSLFLTLQGLFTLFWMLYSWEDPKLSKKHKSPRVYSVPKYSFTAIIPALHEEKVIKNTINTLNSINYPEHLREIIIVNRKDDIKTIQAVREAIETYSNKNIHLLIPDIDPKNKPEKLNYALNYAKNEVVVIFDAEDEPHRDIYNIVNTLMVKENCDVVQSGVQLMNYKSTWFSTLNVLEYFFWFKSALHFFNLNKVTPLGGNTVFFKKDWLNKTNGWNSDCLTEDAEIGIKLTVLGAKIRVVYDEKHTTREETPSTLQGFIKQRTRWHQGFIQIFINGLWLKLPSTKQKLFAFYILLSPVFQALMFLYTPIAIFLALSQKIPVFISVISFLPFFLLILQVVTNAIGIYEFTKLYKFKYSIFDSLKVIITFMPYQLMLTISAFRATYRTLLNNRNWEKTLHINAHRESQNLSNLNND